MTSYRQIQSDLSHRESSDAIMVQSMTVTCQFLSICQKEAIFSWVFEAGGGWLLSPCLAPTSPND